MLVLWSGRARVQADTGWVGVSELGLFIHRNVVASVRVRRLQHQAAAAALATANAAPAMQALGRALHLCGRVPFKGVLRGKVLLLFPSAVLSRRRLLRRSIPNECVFDAVEQHH